jgi:hypothetical protein
MEKIITDSLNNTITMKYDESNDSVTVKNSGVSDVFMEVTINRAEGVEDGVIMLEEYRNYSDWSDDFGKGELRAFWDENKKDKE